MLSFFPRGVLDEILNLIESVSEDFPSYSPLSNFKHHRQIVNNFPTEPPELDRKLVTLFCKIMTPVKDIRPHIILLNFKFLTKKLYP